MADLEHEEGVITEAPDIGTLAVLNKSEIDQQITTAKRYPRSIKKFRDEALQLATLDEQTAAECIYALPRDGKVIEGPSARFAEILAYSWGNTRAGARMIGDDGEFVTSQGLFYDLEKNTAISYEVKRRVTDKRGRRYSADMIGVTSNAASSIALRNAILKGIPKALWKPIYDSARKVVAGDVRTLVNRRAEAMKAFQIWNIKPEQIFAVLGVKGVEDITIEHLVTLKGIYTAIQEGDTTPEQAFAPQTTTSDIAKDASEESMDRLRNKYVQGATPQPQQPKQTSDEPPMETYEDPTSAPQQPAAQAAAPGEGQLHRSAKHGRATRDTRGSGVFDDGN